MTLAHLKMLLLIASQLSGLPIPEGAQLPAVYIEDDAQLQRDYCGGESNCIDVYGYYRKPINEIRVSNNPLPFSTDAVLVHELTHWLERKNGLNQGDNETCLDEAFAYNIENRYIIEIERSIIKAVPPACEE